LSWLSFNARVLQEADDPDVPPLDRLKFLAIFSSNLDEFFRVRVASLRSLLRLKKKTVKRAGIRPRRLLASIHEEVDRQQRRFGAIFENGVLPALEAEGISISFGNDLSADEAAFVDWYFREHVQGRLEPVVLDPSAAPTFLQNQSIYLAAVLRPIDGREGVDTGEPRYGIVPLPGGASDRFVVLDDGEDRQRVFFLDDIIRLNFSRVFPGYEADEAYAVKMTRDAELYLEDEFAGDLVEMIRKGVAKRAQGVPTRFLYDPGMPAPMLAALRDWFQLEDDDLVPGGRYHNYSDFFRFPIVAPSGGEETMPPLGHVILSDAPSILDEVERGDVLLHFPYQSFEPVVRLFSEAADDPTVTEIRVTLYRVAPESQIARALINAAKRGATVTAFVEVKARFDEEPNLRVAEEMEAAGVRILYSLPGIKVHSKLALVTREVGGRSRYVTYLATGNFNERTARQYTDHGLMTCDRAIAKDALQVFGFLCGDLPKIKTRSLLVAPFNLRRRLNRLIEREIENAVAGKHAWILAKMNSLEDQDIIDRLYRASGAGVKIRLIVRGICRLVPGVEGQSENIRVTSIVDRFLEHARVYVFCNGNAPETWLASADWMTRNLSHRVEIAFPIASAALARQIHDILLIQSRDNRKARVVDAEMSNCYVEDDQPACRAQVEVHRYVEGLLANDTGLPTELGASEVFNTETPS
jgi:polyphosphate kinase